MKNKKIILAVVAAVLTLAVAAVAILPLAKEKSDDKNEIRIGVTVYKENDTFIRQITAALTTEAQKLQNDTGRLIYINIADAMDSQSTQNDQIERFITLGYDVLCVNLVDRTDTSLITDMASAAGIPIVFFNREPAVVDLRKWGKLYYVGSDARASAQSEAEIIIDYYANRPEKLDKNGDGVIQYVMLEGESGHQDAMIRTEFTISTLRNAGIELERVDGGIANWNRNQAAALTERYFTNHPNGIELIICNNDDMALGAADAVAKLGLDFPYIVGIDGTAAGKQAVDDGRMLGTVDMDAPSHAAVILKMAVMLADGRQPFTEIDVLPDQSVRLPMVLYKNEKLFSKSDK